MKKGVIVFVVMSVVCIVATFSFADTKSAEKAFLNELKQAIPQEKIKSIEDLYATWQQVQAGKSNTIIIDIRTEAEFDAGHIMGSNNIDSGHAYGIPKKWADPNTEMWVFCRTKHRASYFVSMLYKYGYKNVYLAEGGIKAWAQNGYPLVNKYLGEIQVSKYHKKLKEDYIYRENKS